MEHQATRLATVSEALLLLIKPKARKAPEGGRHRERRTVEGPEFAAMVLRQLRALEARAIEDPTLLPHALVIAERAREIPNVVIGANAERFHVDERTGISINESAAILKVSRQACQQRAAAGRAIMAERVAAAGAASFSEAKRESDKIKTAAESAEVHLVDFRARRSA